MAETNPRQQVRGMGVSPIHRGAWAGRPCHELPFVALLLISSSLAFAQAARNQPDTAGKQLNQGVYVRDSGGALEKLALAQRMERLKEWDKAADVYQEVLDKYADRIVTANPDGSPGSRYANVTAIVQERLAKWPAEGLAAYHRRFEAAAAALLESAGAEDTAALNTICAQYFATTAGKTAAINLIESNIENGEFSAAAWVGERLLQFHPELAERRPKVLFLTGMAEHLSANDADAKLKLDELTKDSPAAAGKLRGQDIVLATELAQILKTPPPNPQGASSESWPMLGGNPSRSRISQATGRVGAKQKQILLSRTGPSGPIPAQVRAQLQTEDRQARDAGLNLGVIPVVDRGELFFQDNAYVYARNLESGMALPGWLNTYPGDADGRYSSPITAAMPPNTQMTVTVTDRAVLAVLRQFERVPLVNEAGNIRNQLQASGETRLVCLDRVTGAELWKPAVSPRQFDQPNLRDLELIGSPLVIGDNVYVAARGGKAMQFDDAYVLCLALSDGSLRWASYIASGTSMSQMIQGPAPSTTVASHLAYDGGRIYVCTDLGAVAALDAYNRGNIVWLSLYPRPNANFAMIQAGFGPNGNAGPKPWEQNPVIVSNGRVFTLPADSPYLIIYDASTGQEIKRIPKDAFDRAKTILAVNGDKLIINSDTSVFCINWPKYSADDPRDDSLHWSNILSKAQYSKDSTTNSIRGRGFVTSDSVFVATQWALHRIGFNNGKVEERYPRDGGWGDTEGPGNVLVTQDHVIIAGSDSVDIYTDMALARAKLDRAVEAAPTEPAPRLEYAEVMFASGQLDVAMEKLDQAIQILGGAAAMRPGADRDRVFADALSFAQHIADAKALPPERIAEANPLFDRAAQAALTPQQQISYRLTRAAFAHATKDLAGELRLNQEILSDPNLRKISVNREGLGASPAGAIAERAIADIQHSRADLYAPIEKLAEGALAAAKSASDPDRFLAVAQAYPNSSVSVAALFAAADSYESAGKPRQATQILNQIYRKNQPVSKARVIEDQARNYLAFPGGSGLGVAIGRLLEGARVADNFALRRAIKLPDNTTLAAGTTFKDAAARLQGYSAKVASASLPDFHLPQGTRGKPFLPENPEMLISDIDQLLLPPRELRDNTRIDRLVTWTANKGLSIFALGKNAPLGTSPGGIDPPRGIAWAGGGGGNDLVVWSASHLKLLAGDNATPRWELPVQSLPRADVISIDTQDAGDEVAPVNVPPGGIIDNPRGRFIAGGRRMRMRANLMRAQMQLRPALPPGAPQPPESIEHVRPLGDRIIIGTSTGRIAAIDLSNGQAIWQTRVSEAAIEQLLANNDFIAARYGDDFGAQIIALDTFTGQAVYRKTFAQESGETPPLNMALAPDGTLVWSQPDRICGKDLYDTSPQLKFGKTPEQASGQLYTGAVAPDQLAVANGWFLAVSDSGQFVRTIDPMTGLSNKIPPLPTGSQPTNWNITLRVIGPRVYVVNAKTLLSYNLEDVEDRWEGVVDIIGPPVVRESFFGRNHVALLSQVIEPGAGAPAAGAGRYRLICYARYPKSAGSTQESGLLEVDHPVTNPAGIDQWQPVEGGFYYRSLDRKLHYLQGAAK